MSENETSPLLEDEIDIQENQEIQDEFEKLNIKLMMKESKQLIQLAWPVVLSYIISFSINMAPIFSLGHLGTKYLASSALSTMFCNVTGFSIGSGLATALDTLCSQSLDSWKLRNGPGPKFQDQ
jgi:Na+-driven multidrug efflux pump